MEVLGAGRRERMTKADLNFLLLQMSQEESTRFYDQLNHHIFELVSSSDANERKGGILAIGEWKCLMPLVTFLPMYLSSGTDFQKEWAFIIRALCLTAQYAGCVLVAGLWKSACKCQHGSCWVLRVAENLVLNGPWALPCVEHQMWVLSMWKFCSWAQLRIVCALHLYVSGWAFSTLFCPRRFIFLFKFTWLNNRSFHPWEGLTWLLLWFWSAALSVALVVLSLWHGRAACVWKLREISSHKYFAFQAGSLYCSSYFFNNQRGVALWFSLTDIIIQSQHVWRQRKSPS